MNHFPPRQDLAVLPTPLQRISLPGLGPEHPEVWIKRDDLTGSTLSGNKVRKLEFIAAEALSNNVDTLITCGGLQSNHCRATAVVGAMLGLRVHLILRDEGEPQDLDANLLLDALAGAVIERVPKTEYLANLQALLEQRQTEYAAAGRKARIIPTGASDGVGIWGYVRCAQELAQDCHRLGFEPDLFVCATGSGGTQAGLTLGAKMFLPSTAVVGYAVCDNAEYFKRKVAADIDQCRAQYPDLLSGSTELLGDLSQLKVKTVDQYIGPGYAKAYPELLSFIAAVARSTGIMLDPVYTGKALYGLVEDIKAGRFSHCERICFVHTGGVFGLFPYRKALEAYC